MRRIFSPTAKRGSIMNITEIEKQVINGYELGKVFTSADVCQDSERTLELGQGGQFGKAVWKYIKTHCSEHIERIEKNSHGQAQYRVVAEAHEAVTPGFSDDIKKVIINYPPGKIFTSIDACNDAKLTIEKAGKVGATIRNLIQNEFADKIKKLNLNATPVKYIVI